MAKSVERAEFFEITENGIKKGLQNAKPFATTNLKEFESWNKMNRGSTRAEGTRWDHSPTHQ